MKIRVIPALALLSAVLSLGAMKDPIEGKWKITAEQDGGGKSATYHLVFKGGKLTVTELKEQGWEPADYEQDIRIGGVGQWSATLKHKTDGEIAFQGSVTGGAMRGTYVKKSADKEERYTFTGER